MPSIKTGHLQIWLIAWPMILANVAITFIGIVDTAILGHLENPAFIGGAAVASSLFNIIYMSLAFLRMGTTGLIGQHFGEKNWQDLYGTLLLSSALGVLLGCLLIISASFIFAYAIPLIGGSAEVQALAQQFAMIRVLSSPFVLFNFVAVGFLIGIQHSRQALILLLFSQGINIFLDFFLAVYLDWQFVGIVWATVISDICGSFLALFFMWQFLRDKVDTFVFLTNFREKITRIFSLNRDIFLRTIILISIFAFITAQSAQQGDLVLAANSILIQVFFFLANAVDGFANAAESKTAEAVGNLRKRGDFAAAQAIRKAYSIALLQAAVFITLVFIVLLVFSTDILWLISSQKDLVDTSERYFFWLYILLYCCLISFVVDGVFIGAAKGKSMLLGILVSTVLVYLPVWYWSQPLANHGIWLSLCIFMLFRSFFSHYLYHRIQQANSWL